MAIFFDPRTGQFVQVTPGGQQTNLKMQTTVNTSQNPGQSGMTSGSGAPPPTGTPAPSSGAGGAAGTGGGGTVNTQGGNISQGAIYGGSVTNTASGGTGSLDASGGSNNVYRETAAPAPAAAPPPAGGAIPGTPPGAECGTDKPCPEGKFCKMGVCEPIPDQAPTFQQFMSSRAMPNAGTGSVPEIDWSKVDYSQVDPNAVPNIYMGDGRWIYDSDKP